MGNIRLITGVTDNPEEADITPEDDSAIFESICGKDAVFSVGEKLKAEIISNNQIKIYDGVLICGGRFARIPQNTQLLLNIKNGESQKRRNDIVVAKFSKDISSDNITIEIKEGAADQNPVDPVIIKGDLYKGEKVREFPLYRIRLNGINLEGIDKLFEVMHPTFEQKEYAESSFNIKEMYNVEDFVCVKKGNLVLFQVSLNGNGQINQNYLYSINKNPIPAELRPKYKVYLHGTSCNGQWGNPREMSVHISQDGYIKYTTPIKQAFFKISGFWIVD